MLGRLVDAAARTAAGMAADVPGVDALSETAPIGWLVGGVACGGRRVDEAVGECGWLRSAIGPRGGGPAFGTGGLDSAELGSALHGPVESLDIMTSACGAAP